jgi:hypothetical protein
MTENKQSKVFRAWQIICLIVAGLVMLLQMYNFANTLFHSSHSLLRFLPSIMNNGTMLLVAMVFGGVYSKKAVRFSESFKVWLMALVTLIIFYLLYFLYLPSHFLAWRLFGVFFPVLTSTSVLLSGIIFALLAQPYLYNWQRRLTTKQNLLILTLLSLLAFALSAGTLSFRYSIDGLLLILPFAWGMFLAHVRVNKKLLAAIIILAIVALGIVVVGVPGFNAVYWSQVLAGSTAPNSWNYQFLNNPTSPFMLLMVIAVFLVFKKVIVSLTSKQARFFVPIIVLMQAPISNNFMRDIVITDRAWIDRAIILPIILLLVYGLATLYERYLFKWRPIKRDLQELAACDSLVAVIETAWTGFKNWFQKNQLVIWTWLFLYVIAVGSFLVQSNNLRIQTSASVNINAVVYLLGTRFFALILTAVFMYAAFAVFYFITTRYWTSMALVTVLALGWAIANKVKLNLRGEPIYPSELGEAANMKTLLPMVGKNLLIMVGIVLVLVIILVIYLEFKHPIHNRTSWRRRGIWALLSLALFMTPMRFNHENSYIYHLKIGFDAKQRFRNPERDIQINGPILNFLNYLDLQIMNKPANYSQHAINEINHKYQRLAARINRGRKNTLDKQTIVFNLSESFVDPSTMPGLELDKGIKNPIPFIQSLRKRATYGYMLSAGYGGGTANMEWETLTGLNMGNFKSNITPYIQVVPNYKFYPTIGMNFNYASAVHPFIGTYYSRIEDYHRFGFNKFAYLGSKYKIIDQKKLGSSNYSSDFTTYANGLKQIKSHQGGQFINLISIQNHMPYNNWYRDNEYMGKVKGETMDSAATRQQMATYIKGTQYTDQAVKEFTQKLDQIKKPITWVFYGDHYPAIISQSFINKYPIQMHATRYFIYSNKYAREHDGARNIRAKSAYVDSSNFIAMMLKQTDSKVTPYQALLTEVHKRLPAITINFKGSSGYELVNQKGQEVDPNSLTNSQKAILDDYLLVSYDMTAGKGYALDAKGFYKGIY